MQEILKQAIARKPQAAAEYGALDDGGRPTAIIRENLDLFRRFRAGELSTDSHEFRFCAQNLGLDTDPAVFALMSPRLQKIVRKREHRRAEHERSRAVHYRRDFALYQRLGYSREYVTTFRADTDRRVPPAGSHGGRERRPGGQRRRRHVQRSTSGADPAPEDPSCLHCGASLAHKNRGATYCNDTCSKRYRRGTPKPSDPREIRTVFSAGPPARVPKPGVVRVKASPEELVAKIDKLAGWRQQALRDRRAAQLALASLTDRDRAGGEELQAEIAHLDKYLDDFRYEQGKWSVVGIWVPGKLTDRLDQLYRDLRAARADEREAVAA